MPLALIVIGIVFLTAAIRGEHELLFKTIKSDFSGPNNFIYWGLAIFAIGAIGYYRPAKPLSNAFMALIVIILLLSNQGFFGKFTQQLGSGGGGRFANETNPNDFIFNRMQENKSKDKIGTGDLVKNVGSILNKVTTFLNKGN